MTENTLKIHFEWRHKKDYFTRTLHIEPVDFDKLDFNCQNGFDAFLHSLKKHLESLQEFIPESRKVY
jgi:hypothetical protein